MIYRSSLSFVTLHWFLAKLQALDLVQFSNQTVFRIFFSKRLQILTWFLACKSITDRVWVSLRSIDFWRNSWPWNFVNFSNQTVFQTFFLNPCRYWLDFGHVSQSPWLTDRVWVSLRSIYGEIMDLGLSDFSDQTVFCNFFLNACRYRSPDILHESQSPWLSQWVGVSSHLIDFSRKYLP